LPPASRLYIFLTENLPFSLSSILQHPSQPQGFH
jgi:hypothetical protein